jgi:hypothetical protein
VINHGYFACEICAVANKQIYGNIRVINTSKVQPSRTVVPNMGSTAPGGRGGGITWGRSEAGGLEVGPSERVLRLFTIEVTLDQTLGNWCHLIKPILRIKDLLTVK